MQEIIPASPLEISMWHGMVFKKKASDENTGDKKIKYSDFLRGTHKSGSAKMKAEYKYKKALRNTKKKK